LLFLERVPARAAINEAVELVKRSRKASAAALANAVLRKLSAEPGRARLVGASTQFPLAGPGRGRPGSTSSESLARNFAHPLWLIERWVVHYGIEVAQRICERDQQVPVTTLRLAPDAAEQQAVEAELRASHIEFAPGALLRNARRVVSGDVTHAPAIQQRRIGIQDEASQLVAALVGRGASILDCCAAPGGKTAAMAERNPAVRIIAADVHAHRARLLRELVRSGRVAVIAADARALPLAAVFERVLADVPCSGTGTLARNPEIKWQLRPEDLADLHTRQVAILRSALERLAPGGRLIYSTCSLEAEENEAVVDEALPGAVGFRVVPARDELHNLRDAGELVWSDLDSLVSGPYLRTLPGVHPCDGFFAAVLEKTDGG